MLGASLMTVKSPWPAGCCALHSLSTMQAGMEQPAHEPVPTVFVWPIETLHTTSSVPSATWFSSLPAGTAAPPFRRSVFAACPCTLAPCWAWNTDRFAALCQMSGQFVTKFAESYDSLTRFALHWPVSVIHQSGIPAASNVMSMMADVAANNG